VPAVSPCLRVWCEEQKTACVCVDEHVRFSTMFVNGCLHEHSVLPDAIALRVQYSCVLLRRMDNGCDVIDACVM